MAGCSNRERSNPLDPANVLTGGAPQGFVAIAGDHLVELRWQAAPPQVPLGYRITRATGNAAPESLTTLAPGVTRFFDGGLANGTDYTYRLAYVLDSGVLGYAASDIATPGSARPWVVDNATRSLQRLAADGRRVAEVIPGPFRSPTALDVRRGDVAFVCDPFGGRLWRVEPGISEDELGSLVQPVAVTLDRARNRVWVADQGLHALQSLDAVNPTAPYADVRGLATPTDVALDPADGSAWVSERTGDRVRHVSSTGGAFGSAVMRSPARVAVDSTTRNLWVVSFAARRLAVFSFNGVPLDSIDGFAGPLGIAIDARLGHIWVADTDGNKMIVYDRNRVRLFDVPGLLEPYDAAIDPESGEAWVVLAGAGEVVRIAPDGRILRRLGGFVQLTDIAFAR